MDHLTRRKSSANFYYRESCPEDVRAILLTRDGSAPNEKWISLRTADPKEARRRLVKVRAEQHASWDELRSTASAPGSLPTIDELAQAAFEFIYNQFVAIHREKLKAQFAQQTDVESVVAQRKRSIALGVFLPPVSDQMAMEKLATIVEGKRNWKLRQDTVEGSALHQEMVRLVSRAVQLARTAIVDELEGRTPEADREQVFKKMGVVPPATAAAGRTIVARRRVRARAPARK